MWALWTKICKCDSLTGSACGLTKEIWNDYQMCMLVQLGALTKKLHDVFNNGW